jgi:O-antigen ligase
MRRTPTVISSEIRKPIWWIRYTYFAFVLSLPFQAADIGIGIGTLSRVIGLMLMMVALLQPSLCLRHPPKAFWYFLGYIYILLLLIFWHGFEAQQPAIGRFFTLSQLLILFWISYNLMHHEDVRTGTVVMLAISCSILAGLMLLNIVTLSAADDPALKASKLAVIQRQGRITAFGANPNTIAAILSLGFLALFGLVFGGERKPIRVHLLAWPSLGVIAMAIVRTGTRGAIVAIIAGLLVFLLKGRGISPWFKASVIRSRLKIGLVTVAIISFVAIFSYSYEPIRVRWEQFFVEGRLSGREKILPEAIGMFLEKPWLGWGPDTFVYELGSRLGLEVKDPHNSYLWILLETGLVGAVPFFGGVWLCWRKAWRRGGDIHCLLSIGLFANLLITGLKGTNHKNKLFWVVLAYALASGSVASLPRIRKAATSSGQAFARALRRRARPRFVAPGLGRSGGPPPRDP